MLTILTVLTMAAAMVAVLAWSPREWDQAESASWAPLAAILGLLVADGVAIGWWVVESWR